MPSKSVAALIALAAGCVATAHAADGPHMRPGLWETTVHMEMPGMPMAMPPMTTRRCVTKEALVPHSQQPGQTCKVLDHDVSGNTVTWHVQCHTNGRTMHGAGKITYAGDSFKGKIDMTMEGGPGGTQHIVQTMTSHRIGKCGQ